MLETSGQLITLEDVAFGDVWVCSGQSNMAMYVRDVRDADREILLASQYQNIRLLKFDRLLSPVPEELVLLSVVRDQP